MSKGEAAAGGRRFGCSCEGYVVILQWDRADGFPGRREERVEDGRRSHADRRLTNAAPRRAAGRHDYRFDLRHIGDTHRIVGVEVRLLYGAILHGAFTVEQCRQAVDERASDLTINLRRIDRKARVRCPYDAVDLNLVAPFDGDFSGRGDIAAVTHMLGQAAEYALRRRLAPTNLFGHRVKHAEGLGMLGHQLAPKLERILAGRMGEFVHEAFQVDGLLVDVHPTPKAWRDRRVMHRMIDQEVWE